MDLVIPWFIKLNLVEEKVMRWWPMKWHPKCFQNFNGWKFKQVESLVQNRSEKAPLSLPEKHLAQAPQYKISEEKKCLFSTWSNKQGLLEAKLFPWWAGLSTCWGGWGKVCFWGIPCLMLLLLFTGTNRFPLLVFRVAHCVVSVLRLKTNSSCNWMGPHVEYNTLQMRIEKNKP